jgi:hypothetical protein
LGISGSGVIGHGITSYQRNQVISFLEEFFNDFAGSVIGIDSIGIIKCAGGCEEASLSRAMLTGTGSKMPSNGIFPIGDQAETVSRTRDARVKT